MTLSVNLTHRFPTFTLNVAFAAESGITALFGRSGAGKSTVANAVAGLLRPESGHIHLADRILFGNGIWVPPYRRRIGYVFQNARLFPHMSVRRNLLYGARSDGGLPAVAELLGITPLLDRRPSGLSGGEQQRVAIGRALLTDPDLLILDEPLSALDTARKAEILPYLERLRDEMAMPMLYVSHSIAEVSRLADRVVLLDQGQVTRDGLPKDVFGSPDLAPYLAHRELGGLITGIVTPVTEDGLRRIDTSGGALWLNTMATAGTAVRIRIAAEDVILATKTPTDISAQNILTGVISDIVEREDGALVSISLSDHDRFVARITHRALRTLDLQTDQPVYAILKTVALNDQG